MSFFVFFPLPPHPFLRPFRPLLAHRQATASQIEIFKISIWWLSLSANLKFVGWWIELHLIRGVFIAHTIFWKPHKMAPLPHFLWGSHLVRLPENCVCNKNPPNQMQFDSPSYELKISGEWNSPNKKNFEKKFDFFFYGPFSFPSHFPCLCPPSQISFFPSF